MPNLAEVLPVIPMVITMIVLVRARLPPRVVIVSIGFGLSGVLIFASCFLLWALGRIAFRVDAGLWAMGLTTVNFGIGILVVNWMLSRENSSVGRDVPPQTGRPPA